MDEFPHYSGDSQRTSRFESPDSPNILDSPPQFIESETFIQPASEPMRTGDTHEDDSNYSVYVVYNAENSNSSIDTVAPWSRLRDVNEDSSSAQPQSSLPSNDNSISSVGIQSLNEESNGIILSVPQGDKLDYDDEPPAKVRKITKSENEDVDGETCPICLDTWGNSGEHRLVALKCGHLFGSKCIERWLKAQVLKERSCPTCKAKASVRDIRFIYARKLVAADTTEVTALQKQNYLLQAEKSRVELELQKTKIAHNVCLQQLESLRNTMKLERREPFRQRHWRFALEKNLEICKEAECRVLTYNCRTYEVYASQKSINNLFPGYGIRKINCVDYKLGQFVHLHLKPIRDIAYSQPADLLLSASLDSSARLVERGVTTTTIQAGVPLWSCTWDCLRNNELYVGGVGGHIQQYDIRNPNSYIQRLSAPGDVSPVVSLCSTEYGLLSCHLNSCWLWTPNSVGQWEPRALPVEGPFMSLCYDKESHKALVSGRSGSNRTERSKISLCRLQASVPNGDVTCEVEQTFSGSSWTSLMSRSTLLNAAGSSWAVSYSECDSSLSFHGLGTTRSVTLPAIEPILDLCSVNINGSSLLTALTKSRLRIYKAVPTS